MPTDIVITAGDQKLYGFLDDSPTARALADALPIEGLAQLWGCGQMEVGKKSLAGSQKRTFGELRLLDLNYQVAATENVFGALQDFRTSGLVHCIVEANSCSGVVLNEDLVAGIYQFADSRRDHANPVLVNLYLFGNTHTHLCLNVLCTNWLTHYRR